MKNKYFSFVALAAAALATSCASDDLAEQKQEQTDTRTVTLTAAVNEGQTRVGMTKGENTTASFYWHKNDQILVQTKNGESYTGTAFSITGDDAKDGDPKATFTGEVTGTVGSYAVYPYSESQKHSFTGEKALTYNLPASYTYTSVESNIFSKTADGTTAYPSNPTNMPMLGTISDKSISFKCLGGLAVIRIASMPAAEGTLTVTADQQLSGDFTVDLSADEAKLATTSTDVNDADKKVTFNFTGAETGKVGVFYLPLATGGYSNVKIQITYGGTTQTINYGNLYVARKSVAAIPLYATGTNGALTKFSKIDGNVYTLNGHEFVDLGLDVLWATMNVGASKAEDVGGYFSWGETTAKTYFSESYTLPGTSTLDAAHDAATVNWGVGVRMPTFEELSALVNDEDCEWTWDGTNNGCTLTKNSQSIFLPAAGAYWLQSTSPQGNGVEGCYWSSTYSKFNYVDYSGSLYFKHSTDPEDISKSTDWPYACARGLSVRAVAEK